MRWNTVRTIRWAMVAVGLVAGVALLAPGATLIGVVLVVMAELADRDAAGDAMPAAAFGRVPGDWATAGRSVSCCSAWRATS